MKISKNSFFTAATVAKIPPEQAAALWSALEKQEESSPFAKYLYYLGALIIISAMTWFMNLSWIFFGGGGLFLIAAAYALFFTLLGAWLWNQKELCTPAGLCITIAVCMTPLAIYGLETYFNFPILQPYNEYYHLVDKNWILIEIGTIAAGIAALRFFPFPFLTAPIFFSAWFLTMDLTPLLFGQEATVEQKSWVSLIFGLVILAIAYAIDRMKKEEYAFWSYLFGTLAFWGGLGCLAWNKGELARVIYLLINLFLMFLAIYLKRNVLMVFGAIGVFAYLAYLADAIFHDSILFPFVLTLIGLAVIYLGILYHKNRERISKFFD